MSGEVVRDLRERHFMTQRDLATRVRCGVPHISKIESGKERPSPELCHAIGMALDTSGEHLAARFGYLPDWADELLRTHPMLTLVVLAQTANSVAKGECCCGRRSAVMAAVPAVVAGTGTPTDCPTDCPTCHSDDPLFRNKTGGKVLGLDARCPDSWHNQT